MYSISNQFVIHHEKYQQTIQQKLSKLSQTDGEGLQIKAELVVYQWPWHNINHALSV